MSGTPTNIYANGPWVLLDEHDAVVDIVNTPRQVGQFITNQIAAGRDYMVDTLEHRCGECGGETKLNAPHAPECPVADGGESVETIGGLLNHLSAHIAIYQSADIEEWANDSASEIATTVDRLLTRLNVRQVDENAIGVTIHGVDVQFRTEGKATTVSVGAEEAPEGQHVVVQDWYSTGWEHELTSPN